MWTIRSMAGARSVLDHQRLAGGEVRGEIHHVLGREVRDLALHDRVLALAVLVVPERGLEVIRVLARKTGERVAGAHAFRPMARGARRGFLAAGLRVSGSGGGGNGERRERCGGEE